MLNICFNNKNIYRYLKQKMRGGLFLLNSILKEKRINLKSTFMKLILSYILLTALILCISVSALYSAYKKQMFEQTDYTSQKLISQASYYMQYNLSWSKTFIYQLYLDSDIYNLMYSPVQSGKNTSAGLFKLQQAVSSAPSIQSIYVYNNYTKTFMTSYGKAESLGGFYDKDIINILKTGDETYSTKFIPRKINYYTGKSVKSEKHILSVVLQNVKNGDSGMPEGALVLNLNADNLNDYYKIMSKNNFNLLVTGMDERVIFSADNNKFLGRISDDSYMKRIVESPGIKGSFTARVGSKNSIINYYKSPNLQLVFIDVTPYDSILESLNNMVMSLLLIFIVLFILGLVFAFVSSKIIYSPLGKIVKAVKSYEKPEGRVAVNEFEYLSVAFNKLINEPITLKKLSKEDIKFMRTQLIEGLLMKAVPDMPFLKVKFEELDINLSQENSIVVLFKLDRIKKLSEKMNADEIQEIIRAVRICSTETIRRFFRNEAVIIEDSTAVVISIPDGLTKDVWDKLIDSVELVQKQIQECYDVTLTSSIGKECKRVNLVGDSYKSACDCMNYRFKYGDGTVLYHEKITNDITEEYKYDESFEENIFNCVKLGNLKQAESCLDKMIQTIKKYSYSDMILSATQLTVNSQKLVNNLYHMSRKNIYMDPKEFQNSFDRFETIDDAREWLVELYKTTIQFLKDKKSNRKSDSLRKDVTKYIEENFCDSLLTPETIAEYIGISPNYLRTIFKEKENMSISSYIGECRYKKARELLETSDMNVNEIAAAVGYTNANYFYTAFKKHFGVSPNQYRLNLKFKSEVN